MNTKQAEMILYELQFLEPAYYDLEELFDQEAEDVRPVQATRRHLVSAFRQHMMALDSIAKDIPKRRATGSSYERNLLSLYGHH